jgi:hypothetical protein
MFDYQGNSNPSLLSDIWSSYYRGEARCGTACSTENFTSYRKQYQIHKSCPVSRYFP